MRSEPSGAIVRNIRISVRETDTDTGEERARTVSGSGGIFHLNPNGKPSDVRRSFRRFCRDNGIIAVPVEWNAGAYSARTGRPIPRPADAEFTDLPDGRRVYAMDESAYQCVGPVDALNALAKHESVSAAHYALNVGLPRGASGSGPEKAWSASGSVFGKPATVKATATTVARQNDQMRGIARKNWE